MKPKAESERKRSRSRSKERKQKDKKKRKSPSPYWRGRRGSLLERYRRRGRRDSRGRGFSWELGGNCIRRLPRRQSRGQLWIGPIKAYKNRPIAKKKNKGVKKEIKQGKPRRWPAAADRRGVLRGPAAVPIVAGDGWQQAGEVKYPPGFATDMDPRQRLGGEAEGHRQGAAYEGPGAPSEASSGIPS